MEKYRAIPPGHMTVGELAKKMGVTVRTLQYYDREGLLIPSAESDGGRRLYTDKDAVKLYQIQSMKYLGFSLDDIKNKLVFLDKPEDVAATLAAQADDIREKVLSLTESLGAIEKLKDETLLMESVNWKKYADIIANIQIKNDLYWLVKHIDDETLDGLRTRFDKENSETIGKTWYRLLDELAELKENGTLPDSEQGQAVAKEWWDMVMEFTGGDMSLLPQLIKIGETSDNWEEEKRGKWKQVQGFLEDALRVFYANIGINPFEEAKRRE